MRTWLVAGAGAVVLASSLAATACAPPTWDTERSEPTESSEQAAIDASRRFLERYVADDGRVVRHDQGGDTISEGQAYAMLVAAAIDDRSTFDRVWAWTREHLQRDDALLSWRWADGAVADPMPATDADVDAAHALALAATRFGVSSYTTDATRIADAVLEHEVIEGAQGPVAVAGPWAVPGKVVNPSYGAPVAFHELGEVTEDPVWRQLDDGAQRVARRSVAGSDLPPDWAVLTADSVDAIGGPPGGPPVHAYDAARVAIRFAVDCDPAGSDIAAAMVDEYRDVASDGRPPARLDLDGQPVSDHGSPVMTVAHAAATLAAGDTDRAGVLLDEAEDQATEHPTYYGDAWIALGRLWLTTDRLDGCRPGELPLP